MRIRAVVVNYNGGDEVLACLRALQDSDGVDLEVVVVDNGSADGSPERIEASLPTVRLVRSPSNLGYPAINNVTNDLTGVDAVAIINPDTVVAPDCLSRLAAALEAEPSIGAACPRILLDGAYREIHISASHDVELLALDGAARWHLTGDRVSRRWRRGVTWSVGEGSVLRTTAAGRVALTVRAQGPTTVTLTSGGQRVEQAVNRAAVTVGIDVDGPARHIVQNAGSVIGPRGLGLNRGYHRPDGPAFGVPTDVPAWCGAAVLLRSDYLADVGQLDPRWFLYYEDTDLSWRGLLRGWHYRYVPDAIVSHAHSTTIGHGSALYDVQHLRNRLLTVTKCGPAREVIATWLDALGLVLRQAKRDVVARVVRDRRLPELVMTGRELRALFGAARLTPSVVRDRRTVRGGATVPDDALPVLGRWHDATGVD
jgi:GT2 family glycosyltransferase